MPNCFMRRWRSITLKRWGRVIYWLKASIGYVGLLHRACCTHQQSFCSSRLTAYNTVLSGANSYSITAMEAA